MYWDDNTNELKPIEFIGYCAIENITLTDDDKFKSIIFKCFDGDTEKIDYLAKCLVFTLDSCYSNKIVLVGCTFIGKLMHQFIPGSYNYFVHTNESYEYLYNMNLKASTYKVTYERAKNYIVELPLAVWKPHKHEKINKTRLNEVSIICRKKAPRSRYYEFMHRPLIYSMHKESAPYLVPMLSTKRKLCVVFEGRIDETDDNLLNGFISWILSYGSSYTHKIPASVLQSIKKNETIY
jgi:hypothetical protein